MLTYCFIFNLLFTFLHLTGKVRVPKVALVSYHKRARSPSRPACFFFFFPVCLFVFSIFSMFWKHVFRVSVLKVSSPFPALPEGASLSQTSRPVAAGMPPAVLGARGCHSGALSSPTPSLSPATSAGSRGTSGGRERNRQNGSETFARCRSRRTPGPPGPRERAESSGLIRGSALHPGKRSAGRHPRDRRAPVASGAGGPRATAPP